MVLVRGITNKQINSLKPMLVVNGAHVYMYTTPHSYP